MQNKVTSVHYCGLLSKGFPETPILSLRLYCLQTMLVCHRRLTNGRYFISHIFMNGGRSHAVTVSYSLAYVYSRVVLCIFTPVYFACMFRAFKSACEYFISHTFISEHWLWYTFSTHLPIRILFLRSTYEWIA